MDAIELELAAMRTAPTVSSHYSIRNTPVGTVTVAVEVQYSIVQKC